MTGGQILLFQLIFRRTHCLLTALRAARSAGGTRRIAPRLRLATARRGAGAAPHAGVPPREDGGVPDSAAEALENEAVRRALSGVAVPVFHQGRECGSTVKHSDQLLMFLLKALLPERYGAPREQTRGRGGVRPVELDIDLSAAGTGAGEGGEGDED